METKGLMMSGKYLKDAIEEVESMIQIFELDMSGKSDIESYLSTSEYEALKVAVNCMKSMWYAKQAMGLAYDGQG